MDITDKCLLVRFCFTSLNNRDFARHSASYRLRREPRLVNLPASEEKKKASGFRFTKNGAQEDLINNFFCDRMVSTSERHGGIRP